jgi:hypothetical protein
VVWTAIFLPPQMGQVLLMKQDRSSLALQSTISSQGRFELKLEEVSLPVPAADEIVVQMEAAPINPADLLGIFGPVAPSWTSLQHCVLSRI